MSDEPPEGARGHDPSSARGWSRRIDQGRRRAGELWRLLRGAGSPARLGVSVGVGLFIGCLPLYGLHVWLCLAVCLPLRLDAVAACLASDVSNPFVAPFLIVAEVELGSYVLHGRSASFDLSQARLRDITGLLYEAALGGVLIGMLLAVAGGLSVALLARRSRG